MTNRARNWRLYRLAKSCSCRPSDLLAISDPYAAFCVDEAIVEFGEALEVALEDATEKAKTKKSAQAMARRVLEKWLGETTASETKQFRSPTPTKKKRGDT